MVLLALKTSMTMTTPEAVFAPSKQYLTVVFKTESLGPQSFPAFNVWGPHTVAILNSAVGYFLLMVVLKMEKS